MCNLSLTNLYYQHKMTMALKAGMKVVDFTKINFQINNNKYSSFYVITNDFWIHFKFYSKKLYFCEMNTYS